MKPLRLLMTGVLLSALTGCGGVISKQLRQEAVPVQGLEDVRADPASFQGEVVILGGDIIETRNQQPNSTTLVVLDRPLNYEEKPVDSDVSEGRFLVKVDRFLDPAVFTRGRKVTVAGTVTGVEVEKVGDAPYRYVVLQAKEVHLWRRQEYAPYYSYPWYPYYSPWYDPFWGPWPYWWGREP